MVSGITRKVLVVDDQADILEAMRLLLKGHGYTAETATSPELGLIAAASGDHDIVLIDMNYARDTTSGSEGLALLDTLHAQRPEVPVIVMTAWSTIELAVEAMRRGACDFITKPWDNDRILDVLARQSNRSRELSVARRVQRRLLPRTRSSAPGIECECVFRPAGEIGGDLCDVFETGPESAALVLGDVSGKGTGAAILMASLQATIRSSQDLADQPVRLIERANRLFFQSTEPEDYASLFFGSYNARDGVLRFVNCGHPPPVLLRADGTTERLQSTGLVLGLFAGASFEEQSIRLSEGDRLVLFSDGVSEAREDQEDQWVVDCLRMLHVADSKTLAESLAMAASSSSDDVTVLDVRFGPSGANSALPRYASHFQK
jgi:sigma-B regulation protein RsbU (phosphoserine phosphatase)